MQVLSSFVSAQYIGDGILEILLLDISDHPLRYTNHDHVDEMQTTETTQNISIGCEQHRGG